MSNLVRVKNFGRGLSKGANEFFSKKFAAIKIFYAINFYAACVCIATTVELPPCENFNLSFVNRNQPRLASPRPRGSAEKNF